jgi:hypothetical protein
MAKTFLTMNRAWCDGHAMRRLRLATVLSFALVSLAAAGPTVTITQCGQQVPRGTLATLAHDLDCSGQLRCWQCDGSSTGIRCRPGLQVCTTSDDCPPPTCPDSANCIGPITADYSFCASTAAVYLDRADLDLAGHTIEGGYAGVICGGGRCRIKNGTITRNWNAIQNSGKVDLTNLTLSDNDNRAVEFSGTPVREVKMTLVTVANNGNDQGGVVGGKVTLLDVVLSGPGSGVLGRKSITATGVTATGDAHTLANSSALATFNGRVSAISLTATGWRRAVDSGSITIRDSNLSGNGCDLFSGQFPRVTNTTCEHSCRSLTESWGVCSAD